MQNKIKSRDFSYNYYRQMLQRAKALNYEIYNLRDFVSKGSYSTRVLLLRHDVDKNPHSLAPMLAIEQELEVTSSVYLRVAGAEYNPWGYAISQELRNLESKGFEIGLHSNYLEFSSYLGLNPFQVLKMEINSLREFYDISSLSCHRDVNYVYNSLPHLNSNWEQIKKELDLDFHAYDESLFGNLAYINEGLDPHLCWRNSTPDEMLDQLRSFYLLTHNHWWYESIPFLS